MNRHSLPQGWEWKRLGEVLADIQPGFACGQKSESDGIPHLRMNNISTSGQIDLSLIWRVPNDPKRTEKYLLRKGDVLFNNTNSIELVGKTALFTLDEGDYVFSNHLTRLRPNLSVLASEWLAVCLRHLWCDRYFERICNRWIGQAAINREKLAQTEIPLPPLDEQRRIVARIEELTRRIEEAKGLRRAARDEASALLPAALHEVFSQAEQEGWEWYTIGEVCTMKTGTTPPSKMEEYYGGDISWFCPGDLGESKLLLQSSRTITQKAIDDRKARVFEGGTVLLVTIGATLGKVGLAPKTVSLNQQITGLLFNNSIVPDYAYWWLRSQYENLRETAPAATLPILNQQALGNIPIAVLPLEEQRRIMAYLDSLQAKIEALRRLQDETQAELNALIPSVLTKAFHGEL